MLFKSGMEMKIKGVPICDPVRFTIDVGHDGKEIALHYDLRFNHQNDVETIILNSRENGNWKQEEREKTFPFRAGQEFETTISFNKDTFYINLPDGKVIEFPNRLGDCHYKFLRMRGDVMVKSILVK